ncbi:uncharacterized protein DS421_9g266950 [Arachis hypogaea]|nr:uncharacterized protein DS421_9g266950 [Arachis hypogaea]
MRMTEMLVATTRAGREADDDAGVEPISSTGREMENRPMMPAATTLAVLEDRDGG